MVNSELTNTENRTPNTEDRSSQDLKPNTQNPSGIVFACVAPHGWTLIPDLADDPDDVQLTRGAMEELGRRFAAARPEVIVLATPHGFRVHDFVTFADVARMAGTLHHAGKTAEMNVPVDRNLVSSIAKTARSRQIPVAMAGFAGNSESESAIPLDWGTFVPLWFMGHGRNMTGYGHVLADKPEQEQGPPVVVINPARSLPWETNIRLGEAIADAAIRDGRRVAFVASCDWAHAHEGSRYGAHPAAADVDSAVEAALRDNDPGRLIDLDPEQVKHAAVDGLWQALMLAGVMNRVPMQGEVLSYEIVRAFSVGMIVATYEPIPAT
jgi:aromatic ring-opening dioxygenase LigB subunit